MGKRFIVFLFCHVVILFFKGIRVFFPLTQSLFLVIVTTHLSFMAFSKVLGRFWVHKVLLCLCITILASREFHVLIYLSLQLDTGEPGCYCETCTLKVENSRVYVTNQRLQNSTAKFWWPVTTVVGIDQKESDKVNGNINSSFYMSPTDSFWSQLMPLDKSSL